MNWKDAVRDRLVAMNEQQGMPWAEIGNLVGENGGNLWQVARGKRKVRPSLARKLGINPHGQHIVAFHCATPEQASRLREVFATYGTRRELRDKLLDGSVVLEKRQAPQREGGVR